MPNPEYITLQKDPAFPHLKKNSFLESIMSRKVFKDLSASSLQVVLNQLLGIVIFYITSRFLAKEMFGELNWSLATASLVISAFGFGIDLMIVRKIAGGENLKQTAGPFLVHVLFTGILLGLITLSVYLLVPSVYSRHILFPGIMMSQILSFFSSPYKQVANGQSLFRSLALISTVSNITKTLLLLLCLLFNALTIPNVIIIFIAGSFAELLAGIILTVKRAEANLFPIYWNIKKYVSLVKESLPQFGVTVFNIVLARFDWIIVGILTTSTIVAEYSFSFKVFELSRLPLLAISPVLIPAFVRIFSKDRIGSLTLLKLNLLFRAEMIISVILPVLLASSWTPLMDSITDNKYGAVNEITFLLLSLCVPLQFATDYFWIMCFAQNQLRLTFLIAAVSCLANVMINFYLVPVYGAEGAAFAYITSFALQLLIFKLYTRQEKLRPDLILLLKTLLCACGALLIAKQFSGDPYLPLFIVLPLYFLFSVITQLVIPKRIKPVLRLLLTK